MRFFVLFCALLVVAPAFVTRPTAAYQKKVIYTCSMHPEVRSSKPGKCPKCGMKLEVQKPEPVPEPKTVTVQNEPPARTVEVLKNPGEYTCTMHPEIRTTAPGKCPKCAMVLVPVTPEISEEFNLKMDCSPKQPKPNEKLQIRFAVFNPRTRQQVKDFYLTHEKLFHLFIVSQDLSEFQHIHPVLEKDGTFTIETMLPAAGNYKVYSDIYPNQGSPQVLQQNITTAGYSNDLLSNTPHLTPDSSLTRTLDGMKIELKLDPAEPISGQPLALKYHLTDAKTEQPVTNLLPYLGAWGHTLMLSQDQTDYVHSHPEEVVPDSGDRSKIHGGPDVTFNAFLPRPGIYRIWTQFQRGDVLTTVSFTIKAERLH